MRLVVHRHHLQIIPENAIDEAYLEEVLGLTDEDSSITLVRRDAVGLHLWAYAETEPKDDHIM